MISPWINALKSAVPLSVYCLTSGTDSERSSSSDWSKNASERFWRGLDLGIKAATAGALAVREELYNSHVPGNGNAVKAASQEIASTPRRSSSIVTLVARSLGSGLCAICGIKNGDLSFPGANPNRYAAIDVVIRFCGFVGKIVRVMVYPEIFGRSIVMALTLRVCFLGCARLIRAIRRWQFSRTQDGAEIYASRAALKSATTYREYRSAEKAYLSASAKIAAARSLTSGEQKVLEQLERRFARYRDYIRNGDLRRLQFELRSDLLRKHFASEARHPKVRDALQRYSGIVCSAFALIATGEIPEPLLPLVHFSRSDLESSSELKGLAFIDELEQFHATRAKGGQVKSPNSGRSRRGSAIFGLIEVPEEEQGQDESPSVSYESLLDSGKLDDDKIESLQIRLSFFQETRHSFGRTALLFSGGARMGLYHIGVMKTLLEHNLLPRIISGSSAGSIVVAVLGCRTSDEIRRQVFDANCMNLKFFGRSDGLDQALQLMLHGEPLPQDMQDSLLEIAKQQHKKSGGGGLMLTLLKLVLPLLAEPFPSYVPLVKALLPSWTKTNMLLDIQVLGKAIKDLVGDMTFQEAYEKTGRTINITATPFGGDRDIPLLLNYLSSPYVTVASACMASCCIPGVFSPVKLVSKTLDGNFEEYQPSGLSWIDGSLESDLPMQRLSELFNVSHFIVSQVEPHARLFAPADPYELEDLPLTDQYMLGYLMNAVRGAKDMANSYVTHLSKAGLKRIFELGIGKTLTPAMVQRYDGDITLYPRAYFRDFYTLLQNPTHQQYNQAILEGERMTWQKLRKIRTHCMIEFMMDDCCHALDARLHNLRHRGIQQRCEMRKRSSLLVTTAAAAAQQNKNKPSGHHLEKMLLNRMESEPHFRNGENK